MKRILLLAATCLLTLGINAQALVMKQSVDNDLKAGKSRTAFVMNGIRKAPRKALASNQFYCGLYTSDEIAEYGLGMGTYTSGVCKAGTFFTKSIYQSFIGFKVVGMRVAVCCDITDFGVFVSKIEGESIVDFFSKEVGTASKGWNTVMFDESEQFEIPADGTEFLTGFSYMQLNTPDPDYPGYCTDDCYPISYVEGLDIPNYLMFYGDIPASVGGSGEGWYAVNSGGSLSVQWIVEGVLPDQHIALNSLAIDKKFYKAGENITANISVSNLGKDAISSLGFSIYVDGTKVADQSVAVAIDAMENKTATVSIPVPAGLATGSHTLKAELATVNGSAPTGQVDNGTLSAEFKVYKDSKPRQKHLIEHFTSNTCTYCPLGYQLMRNLESNHSDVAWVSIHGNMNGIDPLNFTECDQLQDMMYLQFWPGASFNRVYDAEMADGAASLIYNIGYNEEYIPEAATGIYQFIEETAEPSFVALDIQQNYDADSRTLNLTVKGTGAEDAGKLLAGYGITLYITEAGLKGRQLNQGRWINNYEHNNALRMVLTSVGGDAITWNGDNFEYTKSITIPTEYVAENLSITAFVAPQVLNVNYADVQNMAVNNCEKVALDVTSSGINDVNTNSNVRETTHFTVGGQQLNAPNKGINIVKMSDGTIRKVVVK